MPTGIYPRTEQHKKHLSERAGRPELRDYSDIGKLYLEDKLSRYEIARLKGCCSACVQYAMKKQGIQARNRLEALLLSVPRNPTHTGYYHTEEIKQRISQKLSGSNAPNWKGGVTYLPYSPEFNDKLKEEIRARDGYRCRECGSPQDEWTQPLPVHHIDEDKLNTNKENLITLCPICHGRTHHT